MPPRGSVSRWYLSAFAQYILCSWSAFVPANSLKVRKSRERKRTHHNTWGLPPPPKKNRGCILHCVICQDSKAAHYSERIHTVASMVFHEITSFFEVFRDISHFFEFSLHRLLPDNPRSGLKRFGHTEHPKPPAIHYHTDTLTGSLLHNRPELELGYIRRFENGD